MEGSNLFNLSNNVQSTQPTDSTAETFGKIYTKLPRSVNLKIGLVALLVIPGLVGLLGNSLIHYFVLKKKSFPLLQSTPFVRNLNLYIRSLTLSNILSSLVSLPLLSVQLCDIFHNDWPCRIVRYIGMLFPTIALNNLIFISIEKFSSTRDVPKSFSVATVRKLVYGAWIIGCLSVLAPAAVMSGVRSDINATHYTVVCKIDKNNLSYRVIGQGFGLIQFFIPSIILLCINLIIARRVWKRQSRRINIQRNNAIKVEIRSSQIRGTYLLIFFTFVSIVPYSFFTCFSVYVNFAKHSLSELEADFIIRYLGGALFFSSSAINVIMYLVQMKSFRVFLKTTFCGKGTDTNTKNQSLENGACVYARHEGGQVSVRITAE